MDDDALLIFYRARNNSAGMNDKRDGHTKIRRRRVSNAGTSEVCPIGG